MTRLVGMLADMTASAIMSIDQGTTSSRVVIYDEQARVVSTAQREHRQYFPQPGWVEHDALDIWNTVRELMGLVTARAGMSAEEIACIGITNQRETTVLWDAETGRPVHRAIVWQDTRTDDLLAAVRQRDDAEQLRRITGLPLASYFCAPKIAWILEHSEAAREAADRGALRFGTMDTWLLWNLTGGPHGGVHATDITNASRTLLMDLEAGQWKPELGERFGLSPAQLEPMLPEIRPSAADFGRVSSRVPLSGVHITGILGDQQSAAFGQGVFAPGEVKNTYGTGCFLLHNTGHEVVHSEHGLLSTVAYQLEGEAPLYALEGSIAQAGSVVQWLRDNLGVIAASDDVERLAGTVTDNGGVYFVPAFSGLFAPHWRPDARGLIIGLTGYATAGHIARAALEATAFQTRDVLAAVIEDTGMTPEMIRADGGMTVNDELMQFQADVLAVPVQRPKNVETTALGAAYAAGLSRGVWTDTDQLRKLGVTGQRWEPTMPSAQRRGLIRRWDRAVEHAQGWLLDEA
ncbi:MAG: glycerol kinase GlpK [Micrococcaceae bacterium]